MDQNLIPLDKMYSMPAPEFVIWSSEQVEAVAQRAAEIAAENVHKRMPKREPRYLVDDPEIFIAFPGTKTSAIKRWCRQGLCGKFGEDKRWRVTLSELAKLI
jgi:hypothetical protein